MASEIKANKISPATGTAFTIGDSGDTFTLPSGATLSGAGAITIPSGGSLTIDSGATITNNGTGVGLGKLLNTWRITDATQTTTSSTSNTTLTGYTTTLTNAKSGNLILAFFEGRSKGVTGETAAIYQVHLDGSIIGLEFAGATHNNIYWHREQTFGLVPADDPELTFQLSSNRGGFNATHYEGTLIVLEVKL